MFPITWIIAIPLNFVIDSIVILLSLKFLRIEEAFQKYKKVILKVFLFGFFSDFIGAIFLFLISTLVVMGGEQSSFLNGLMIILLILLWKILLIIYMHLY